MQRKGVSIHSLLKTVVLCLKLTTTRDKAGFPRLSHSCTVQLALRSCLTVFDRDLSIVTTGMLSAGVKVMHLVRAPMVPSSGQIHTVRLQV